MPPKVGKHFKNTYVIRALGVHTLAYGIMPRLTEVTALRIEP